MTSDNTLLVIAIIAVIVSAVGLSLTYSNAFALDRILLSPNETGNVTLTIEDNLDIDVTDNIIDWGSGFVTSGQTHANLTTTSAGGAVVGASGNWATLPPSTSVDGFTVVNVGNKVADLYLTTGKNATNFICNSTLGDCGTGNPGGAVPAPLYLYNVTNTAGAGGCTIFGSFTPGVFIPVNTTDNPATPHIYKGTLVCDHLQTGASNSMRVDIKLLIPADSRIPTNVPKNDTMYFTAVASSN